MPVTADQRRELLRHLAGAVGWAVFIGGGIALGLALGSVGADVPADSGMLWYVGLIVSVGTLIVRLAMVAWRYRDLAGGAATTPGSTARRPPEGEPEPDEDDLEPVGAPPRRQAASRATAPKRAPAKGGGARSSGSPTSSSKSPSKSKSKSPSKSGGTSSARSSSRSSSAKKKPASGATKPRQKPRKKPGG